MDAVDDTEHPSRRKPASEGAVGHLLLQDRCEIFNSIVMPSPFYSMNHDHLHRGVGCRGRRSLSVAGY